MSLIRRTQGSHFQALSFVTNHISSSILTNQNTSTDMDTSSRKHLLNRCQNWEQRQSICSYQGSKVCKCQHIHAEAKADEVSAEESHDESSLAPQTVYYYASAIISILNTVPASELSPPTVMFPMPKPCWVWQP